MFARPASEDDGEEEADAEGEDEDVEEETGNKDEL